MKIELHPCNAKLGLNNLAGESYEYDIKYVKLHCVKYKPYDAALISCNKYLLHNEIEYLIRRPIVHDEIISAGTLEHNILRPFGAFNPPKIYLWLADLTAVAGSHAYDPFAWKNHNLAHYSLKINGSEVDYCKIMRDKVNIYHKSKQAHGSDYFTPYRLYVGNSFFIVSDCRLQSPLNSIHLDSKGNLCINLRFSDPLVTNIKAFVLGEVDSTFHIDNDRSITCNYQI